MEVSSLMSRVGVGGAGSGRGSSGFGKMIAAGLIVVVIGVAAALFIVNRKGGGDDGGGSVAGGGGVWNAGGEPMDSRSVAARFEWADRKADINGQMVYKPEPRIGKILSRTTRSYPSPTGVEASTARPEGVIFETIDMATMYPIPFSISDGPTAFEGNVPVGYSRSAAGAALAAGAYNILTIQMNPDPQKAKTIIAGLDSSSVDAFRQFKERDSADMSSKNALSEEAFRSGYIMSPAGYKVAAYDGSYAKILICTIFGPPSDWKGKNIGIGYVDLVWTDQGWKAQMYTEMIPEHDSLPEGLISWTH
ncbi:hypothetical protein [Corynebacterium bovis]